MNIWLLDVQKLLVYYKVAAKHVSSWATPNHQVTMRRYYFAICPHKTI